MNKTKVLGFAVIALFLLNICILAFLFLNEGKVGPKGRRMPREILIDKLHFDKNQIKEYDKIIMKHQQAIRVTDDSIRSSRNELYQLLNTDPIDLVKRDSLYLKFASFQKQIETTHFNHFIEIKNICKQEQMLDFKILTEELTKIFNNGRKPKNE